MTLTEADLDELRGINERVSLDEVADIYVPLARLLSLHVTASQELFRVTDTFLGNPHRGSRSSSGSPARWPSASRRRHGFSRLSSATASRTVTST